MLERWDQMIVGHKFHRRVHESTRRRRPTSQGFSPHDRDSRESYAATHGGSLGNAVKLIWEASQAGADAVKFQCFDPERLAAKRATNAEVLALAGGKPLVDLYKQIHTPREWFPRLIATSIACDIPWFSSVFDPDDVAFLETLGCPRYKISAFEMLDWELIKAIQETGKPIVLSVRPTENVTIMQATDYEGKITPLGLSDHGRFVQPKPDTPMVEWHLCLDGIVTPDSDFSLTPKQLSGLIRATRRGQIAA